MSRCTGFLRAAAVAGVLGPTYLGNTYVATNLLPNLLFEFLTGSLLASVLVPPLVRRLDADDREAADRLAGGFLTVAVLGLALIAVVAVVLGPLLLRVLTVGVTEPGVGVQQRRAGMLLLLLVSPQVVLYGVAAVGGAAMNARGRFALAAGAPALENLGVIATIVAFALAFGSGSSLANTTSSQLLLLGGGSTAAVALHAAAQWWGAARCGVVLRPRRGWRNPEVRQVLGALPPSLGYAALNAGRVFAALIVANRIQGGVVAFQLALNFYHLPIAVAGRPVAIAYLPQLARSVQQRAFARAAAEFRKAAGLSLFLTVPAAVAYLALAEPLARAAAFGNMSNSTGRSMLAVALASLSVGVIGEVCFTVCTHVAYAVNAPRAPFQSMMLRTAITTVGMALAFSLNGTATLLGLGLAISAGNVVSAVNLHRRVRSRLPDSGGVWSVGLVRALGGSALMVPVAWLTVLAVRRGLSGSSADPFAMGLAVVLGAMTYLGAQMRFGAPEWRAVREVVWSRAAADG